MQTRTPFTIGLTFISACGLFKPIDPCATDPNGNYTSPLALDPNVAADCQACKMSPCPEEGETGEDPPGDQVTAAASDHRYVFDGTTFDSVKANIAVPGGLVEIDRHQECGADFFEGIYDFNYTHYECGLNWGGWPAHDWMDNNCVTCDSAGGIDFIPFDGTGAWPACPSNASPALMGAWVYEGQPTCTPNAVDPTLWDHVCPEGHVQIWEPDDPWTHFPSNNWTCRCPSGNDSECQPGAHCEAGWRPNPMFMMPGHLSPTICTWDDGEGDENGAAPEGPIVYELVRWEEGIDVTTRRDGSIGVRVTPSFLLVLMGAAPWNDDQRFDIATGELTYCGEDALCDWLGLAAGDRLRFPTTSGLELLTGRELQLVVAHANRSTTTFVVSIDFDGKL
jgi:hypothetical protein